jgi:hypothetical protein
MNNAKENNIQKCPWCAEEIQIDAYVCKHCGAHYEKTDKKGTHHWLKNGTFSYTFWDKLWHWIWNAIKILIVVLAAVWFFDYFFYTSSETFLP